MTAIDYEVVIGLEVHAQLQTQSKLFCGCSTAFGADTNSQTCAVCLGMPGTLPVPNKQAVVLALRAALGLGCDVHLTSQWSRKNYFYPDLPKGYQITQYDQPYATGGAVPVPLEHAPDHTVPLTRIHMEEDAGKSVHDASLAGNRSYVDFNRGGTPLIEIVSEPAIRSSVEAAAYLKVLRQTLRALGVCDGNMEQGSLRCDANVSLRPRGATKLGTRTELKNINSFRFVQQAIDYEVLRQQAVLDGGGQVVQETRLWDSEAKVTRSMRSKEEAHDYRYFPDPDLPDLMVSEQELEAIRADLPELPTVRRQRYVDSYGLSDDDARILSDETDVAAFFETAAATAQNHKLAANWIIHELLRELKDQPLDSLPFGAEHMGALVRLIHTDVISGKIAKSVFADMLKDGTHPEAIVDQKGLRQVTDTSAIEPIVDQVLADNPDSVAAYKGGKQQVVGFLVGQVMKASKGKANPKMVNQLLRSKLS